MVLLIFQSLYGPPDESIFCQVDNRGHMGDHAAGTAKVQVNNIHRLPHEYWASHPSMLRFHYMMLWQPTTCTNLEYFCSNIFARAKEILNSVLPQLLESAAAQFVHGRGARTGSNYWLEE